MVVFRVKMLSSPENKEAFVEILLSVKGPTESRPGCVSSRIYQDVQDEKTIIYEEVWRSEDELINHIRSSLFRNVLIAMDMSVEHPDIEFNELSGAQGMDLIETALGDF